MAKEFVVIETQEQFDAAISARIGALTSKHNEATAELQKQIEALKTENQNLSKGVEEGKTKDQTIAELQGQIKGFQIADMRAKAARDAGLSFDAVRFLAGESEEEIKASAEALAALIPKGKTPNYTHEPDYHGNEKAEDKALNDWLKNERKG